MKTFRHILSIALAVIFVLTFAVGAFAEEYDLSVGEITIGSNGTSNVVTQLNGVTDHVETSETVLTGTGTGLESSHADGYVKIDSTKGDVEVTFKDATVRATSDGDGNDWQNNAVYLIGTNDITLNIEGANTFKSDYYRGFCGDEVSNVTLQGTDMASCVNVLSGEYDFLTGSWFSNSNGSVNYEIRDLTYKSNGGISVVSKTSSAVLSIINSDVDIKKNGADIQQGITVVAMGSTGDATVKIDNSYITVGKTVETWGEYPALEIDSKNGACTLNILNANLDTSGGTQLSVPTYELAKGVTYADFMKEMGINNVYTLNDANGNFANAFKVTADRPRRIPEASAGATAKASASPLFRVVDSNKKDVEYTVDTDGSTMTVTSAVAEASFVTNAAGLRGLKAKGIENVKFVCDGSTVSFGVEKALESIGSSELIIKGGKLTIGGVEKTL